MCTGGNLSGVEVWSSNPAPGNCDGTLHRLASRIVHLNYLQGVWGRVREELPDSALGWGKSATLKLRGVQFSVGLGL